MSFGISIFQTSGVVGDILSNIVNVIVNLLVGLFANIGVMLYTTFILPLYLIADGVFLVFRKFAGLDTYSYQGQYYSGDVVLSLIEDPTVQNVFWALLILGVILLVITTIIAVIKNEMAAAEKSKSTNAKIITKSFRALVNMFIVPVVAILGVFMGNAVLKSLDKATSGTGETVFISGMVFRAAAYECNRARQDEVFAQDLIEGLNSFDVIKGSTQEEIAESLDNAFITGAVINGQSLDLSEISGNLFSDSVTSYSHIIGLTLDSKGTMYIPRQSFSIYDSYFVAYYYDLLSFNYVIGLVVLVFSGWILLSTAIGLVKRMFKLSILLMISPPVVSIAPLDDGKALGKWRGEFIGSCLSAYGTVVGLNLFILLLQPIQQINFFAVNTGNQTTNTILNGLSAGLLNPLVMLLILVAGLLFFKDMPKMISSIIGAENAYEDGAKQTKDIAKKVGTVAAVATGVGGAALNTMRRRTAEGLAKQASDKAKSLGERIDALKSKKGRKTKAEKEEIARLEREREEALGAEKAQTEAAGSYGELASARLKQARSSGVSLATGGLSDVVMKELDDKGVAGARKGNGKDKPGTDALRQQRRDRRDALRANGTRTRTRLNALADRRAQRESARLLRQAERIESTNAEEAQRLRQRATMLTAERDARYDESFDPHNIDHVIRLDSQVAKRHKEENPLPEYVREEKRKKAEEKAEQEKQEKRVRNATIRTARQLRQVKKELGEIKEKLNKDDDN